MVKIGDIIYYESEISGEKNYCKCVAVTNLKGYAGKKQVWGDWSENLDEVRNRPKKHISDPNGTGRYTYMELEKVKVIRKTLKSLLEEWTLYLSRTKTFIKKTYFYIFMKEIKQIITNRIKNKTYIHGALLDMFFTLNFLYLFF